MAELSVVVPFYNVEPYIGVALESIARQTLRDLEVIMVDDGSVDGSSVIAKDYAARDPRFRLVKQENQGLGPARNTGVRHADGTYIAFADSDDLLHPHAYELLVGSLNQTGSDIACGGVLRFNSAGASISWLHQEPFRETMRRTHITRHRSLMQDRTAWNKVFRRSFWDANGLEFPGTLYEDGPVTIRAHVLASSVDIFRDVVYYWRFRDSGELSITQRARELANVEDRMASVRSVGGFLAERAPALKPVYDRSVLDVDLDMLIRAYELASQAERERLADLAVEYLRTVDMAVYRQVDAIKRLRYYLLRERMFPELLQVLRFWASEDRASAATVRHASRDGGRQARWYVRYPFFGDPGRGIPDEVYDVTDEMTLHTRLDAVSWQQDRLRIEGHAYIRRLDAPAISDTRIEVLLCNTKTRRTIQLPVQRVHRPDVTARSNQAAACYDWSGFVVEVAPRRLATLGLWRAANWELKVRVSGPGISREGPVNSVAPGSAQWPEGRWVKDGIWVQPAPQHDGRFVIRGRRVGAFLTGCRASDGWLEIEGWASGVLSPGATLVISPRKGGGKPVRAGAEIIAAHTGSAHRTGPARRTSRTGFRARLPVTALISSPKAASLIDQETHVHDEVTWDISLDTGNGESARLTAAPASAGARASHHGREITVFVTPFGYVSVLERTSRPAVSDLEWTADQRLILRGSCTDPADRPDQLLLRDSRTGAEHHVPVSWDGPSFTASFSPARMPGLAGELPMATGYWNLLSRTSEKVVTVVAARSLVPRLPSWHRTGMHEVAGEVYRVDALRLQVRTALAEDERGRYAQRQLASSFYPAAQARPLRELAVFDSFGGLQYSCNPRAIHEELRRRHPGLDCAWVTRDGQFTVPDGTSVVLAESREHYEALARARYVVTNNLLPSWYRKRPGQLCLQTWHGTPLKRIGHDIDHPQFSNAVIYPDLLRQNAASWDLLLSQNAFSTPVFRRALGFDGEIAETGYPRNDILRHRERAQRAAQIRRHLGIPAGKRVVLYAPTWRDDAFQQDGRYRFDLRLDLEAASRALGGGYLVLLRLHSNVRNGLDARPADRSARNVLDVTRYPDISDLYLISDVLITDYSSAMFDFAVTGRPMLFFTYDLDRYRDRLRGFYFDLEAEAPGPLLRTSGDVIDALAAVDRVAQSYQPAYREFVTRYCSRDDGKAAARAVDLLLGG